MTIQELTNELTQLESDFNKFSEDIIKRMNENHEVDFVPTALIWIGIHKYKLLQFLQKVQNKKATLTLDIDTAARNSVVKITESKISKLVDANPDYQILLLLIAKVKGIIDAMQATSIALSTAVKIWNGGEV